MSPIDGEPRFWRSLAEREEPETIAESPEFSEPVDPPTSEERRRFLQLSAASVALAGGAGCRWQEDRILPYAERAEGVVPGVPRYFTTAMDVGGEAVGLRVKSYDGRPIKVDGNSAHPDSLGASKHWHQASILELYDPDCASGYSRLEQGERRAATELELKVFLRNLYRTAKPNGGEGLCLLFGASSSPSRSDLLRRLQGKLPRARFFEHEPARQDGVSRGAQLAFGAPTKTHYALDRARIIVSLGADLFGARNDGLRLAREWASRRDPAQPWMNRLYVFESAMSDTGAAADHRVSLRSEHLKALAAHLDAALSSHLPPRPELGPPQPFPESRLLTESTMHEVVAALVQDLTSRPDESVVVAGEDQPAEVHAIVHRINALLGNRGKIVSHTAPAPPSVKTGSLTELGEAMGAGQVKTLVILDSNPVYTAPGDLDFGSLLAKVPTKIVCSLFLDETARYADWHVPMAHYLTAWGDVRASDGSISVQQPLIAPLYGGKSVIEVLALLSRDVHPGGEAIVKRTLRAAVADERAWRRAVHDGVVPGSGWPSVQRSPLPQPVLQLSTGERSGREFENGQLELTLAPDPRLYDGRFANNGWLQELPDSVTKLTWGNALMIGPATGKRLGLKDGKLAKLTLGERSLTVPVLFVPGQGPGAIRLYVGHGRTAAGRVGGQDLGDEQAAPVGVNAYPLVAAQLGFVSNARVEPAPGSAVLATTQDKHSMDRIGRFGTDERLPALVRQANLDEYREHPDFAPHRVHHPPLLSLWKEPVRYDGHKWGMSIDLNKCTGCSGCVVACQSENNIPVVGQERVAMGREMHWIRVDRYFQGDPEQPEAAHQPVPCMHCEHAPCEQVCPVGATLHSSEGLNDMTYNRCIGTRYCSNNCPYKVRRFNYFNFHEDMKEEKNQVKGMVFNPEVTVRFRGVMEKCSYCVQRIQEGKFRAGRENRPLQDGEVTTACQDSCPTQAITFGDINDPRSDIAAKKRDSRDYALLQELNVRPRTTYMARVKNPHPELV